MGVDQSSVEKQPASTGPGTLQGGCCVCPRRFPVPFLLVGEKGLPTRNPAEVSGKVQREGQALWLHTPGDTQCAQCPITAASS